MDVTRHNLAEGLALLRSALESERCEFVAFDEEMTGISFGNAGFREFNGLGDSAARRYGKMRPVAGAFGLVQIGIAAFVRSEDGAKLRAHVFNIYVFPGERPGGRDVMVSAGAIQFLANHGMSFDGWLCDGAPYVDRAGAEALVGAAERANAEEPGAGRSPVQLTNKDWKAFADAQLKRVKRFFGDAGAAPKLKLEIQLEGHDHALVRKFLYQEIEGQYPSLVTEKRPRNVIAVLALPEAETGAAKGRCNVTSTRVCNSHALGSPQER